MTRAEALAYNLGVLAVLEIATRAAEAISATSRRPVADGFATAALSELAEVGRAILIADENEQLILPPAPASVLHNQAEVAR